MAPLRGRAVTDTGVRSMFGVRLLLDNTQRGALNFYASQPGVFTDLDLDLALGAIFASHASLALLNATHQAEAECPGRASLAERVVRMLAA